MEVEDYHIRMGTIRKSVFWTFIIFCLIFISFNFTFLLPIMDKYCLIKFAEFWRQIHPNKKERNPIHFTVLSHYTSLSEGRDGWMFN